jgi:hypothetical protein
MSHHLEIAMLPDEQLCYVYPEEWTDVSAQVAMT